MRHMALLSVRDLNVSIGPAHILRGISFDLEPGQTLGLVGESGCGKSMLGLSLMGMLPPHARVEPGSILFENRELVGLKEREMNSLRGGDIALVMQDPFTSLNPLMRISDQIEEAVILHQAVGKAAARTIALEMLRKVGIPDPELAAKKFPHELSGGQRQRVVIAIAFCCKPKLLIADEPTTALDVTLEAQILRLILDLQAECNTAVILISHNIGVIASICDEIAVVYAGQFVETGPTPKVLKTPGHPYTQNLMAAMPNKSKSKLQVLLGQPPDFTQIGTECAFSPRCGSAFEKCKIAPGPRNVEQGHEARCWLVGSETQN